MDMVDGSDFPSDRSERFASPSPHLWKGAGWRLGRQPHHPPYTTLLGSDDWAMELTEAEWQAFCQALQQLRHQWQVMRPHLMAEESLTLEQGLDLLTLIATGEPDHFRLYLRLHQGRASEGVWSPSAVAGLVQQVDRLAATLGD
ncbi:MAG: DUF1818 family protein [Cyanobacteriota bacterium]|nr:DUF1818 family protein [Cyanobacteriota bacterium]